ncbi:MAG: TonB-dependent receptor [Alphaproteobacteria bacterium]
MLKRLVALSALAAVTAAPVAAQEDGGKLSIDTVITTAEKREESAQTVGVSVTALDEKAIENLNARTITDLVGLVPNMVIAEGGLGPSLANISLRGVSFQDPEKSFDPAIGVFVDGIYLGSSAFNLLDTFDLQSIEVLRGPQGTLFGRNTTGGAILAYRTRPTMEWGGKLQVTAGGHGRHDFKGVLNLPVVEDKVGVKVAAYSENDSGLWDNSYSDDGPTGAKDRWGISGSVLLAPSDSFELLITYDHAEDDSELVPYAPRGITGSLPLPVMVTQTEFFMGHDPGVITPTFGPDLLCLRAGYCEGPYTGDTMQGGPHFQNSKLDALTVNADWDVSDTYTVTAIFGWRKSSEAVFIDFDAVPETFFHVVREQQYEQFTGELRIASNYQGPFNFVAGAFYYQADYSLQQAIQLDLALAGAPFPPQFLFVNGAGDEDEHSAETVALFAQADWDVTDTITLTAGLRASWDEKEVFTDFKDGLNGGVGPEFLYSILDGVPEGRPTALDDFGIPETGGAKEDWFELTPKVAISWQANDNLLAFFSWTRGYNAGGFSARAGDVPSVTTPFDPETIDAFELGIKSDWLDGRLRFNANLFWNDYQDKQEEVIQPAPPPTFTSTTVRNVSSATLRGFEMELTYLFNENFRLDASFGYLDAEYDEFIGTLAANQYAVTNPFPPGTPASELLLEADFSGLRLRQAPEITFSITPTFSAQIGNHGYLTISATARYVDDVQTQVLNDPRGARDSRFLLDAYISYEFGGADQDQFQLKVFGKNLTKDVDYTVHVNSIVDFGALTQPRTWGVEVTGRF